MISEVDFASFPFTVSRRAIYPLRSVHAHLDLELLMMQRGHSEHTISGERFECRKGQFLLFWAGMPHRCISADHDNLGFILHLPLAWALTWSIPQEFIARLLRGEIFTSPGRPTRWLQSRLNQWSDDEQTHPHLSKPILLLEVRAALLRLAMNLGPSTPIANTRDVDPRAIAMAEYITRHFTRPLKAAQIASIAGVHPNHAMRLFTRSMGVSFWGYIGQLRISHAQHLLGTTDRKIADIAMASGFSSMGRFYTMFQSRFQHTPRAHRLALQRSQKPRVTPQK